MAYRVVWTDSASSALSEIAAYLEREAPGHVSTVVREILDIATSLDELPFRGRIVPELKRQDTRELFIYSYRLIYRVSETSVYVMSVFHGRRRLTSEMVDGRQEEE